MRLPVFGARRYLRDGAEAARVGRVDDALGYMRAYIAVRSDIGRASSSDVQAAILAATCTALRHDAIELSAVRSWLVRPDPETDRWFGLLERALAGDVDRVLEGITGSPPIVQPLGPALLVLAFERGGDRTSVDLDQQLTRLAGRPISSRSAPRLAIAAARAYFTRGDRERGLEALRAISPKASTFYAFARALAGTPEEIEVAWRALPVDDREAAASLSAIVACGASVATAGALYRIAGDTTLALGASLLASYARAMIDAGRLRDALAELDAARQELQAEPAVVLMIARLQLAVDEPAAALATMGTPSDPAQRDVAIVAAIRSHAELARIAELVAIAPETAAAPGVRDELVAFLADRDDRDAFAHVPWLDTEPVAPRAAYAWAVWQLRRGRAGAALAAFDRAIGRDPRLAELGDEREVACIAVAREAIEAGNPATALDLLRRVRAPRLVETALLHAAVAIVSAERPAGMMGAPQLARFVHQLINTRESDDFEHRALAAFARLADDGWARTLLRDGRIDEARPILRRLAASNWTLHRALLGIFEDQPLATIERLLAQAVAQEQDPMLPVLLAAVRNAKGDATGAIAVIESARGGVAKRALADAYGEARRGLDAKRAAIEELRRPGATLHPAVAAELRRALAFEAPPAISSNAAPPVQVLPGSNVLERATQLVHHAERRRAASPQQARAIDDALRSFKEAVALGDIARAARAERNVLQACKGAAW